MTDQFIVLIVGLALLWIGAELLIRYSSALARSLGVSPLIVGLTIVSIGTSLPEFVVSLMAALQDTMGISIGNIIGSNIANMGLILGTGALISPLVVRKSYVTREVPLMILFTVIFSIFARTGFVIGRWEGLILFVMLLLFLFYLSRASFMQIQDFQAAQDSLKETANRLTTGKKILYLLLSVVGIALLITGSKSTVNAGKNIALAMGVSDTIIGLTLIAVGTSLPELATTIVGVAKNETEIVVGNVIGSNIFNLLFIGGVVPVIHSIPIETQLFYIEFPFLLILSILIWPVMRVRWGVYRPEGVFLMAIYVLFIIITFNT